MLLRSQIWDCMRISWWDWNIEDERSASRRDWTSGSKVLEIFSRISVPLEEDWHADSWLGSGVSACVVRTRGIGLREGTEIAPLLSSEESDISLLSRRKVYSILYNSTLILPSNRRGERLLRLLLLFDCCGREQEVLLLHGGKYMVYIVII